MVVISFVFVASPLPPVFQPPDSADFEYVSFTAEPSFHHLLQYSSFCVGKLHITVVLVRPRRDACEQSCRRLYAGDSRSGITAQVAGFVTAKRSMAIICASPEI